MTDADCVLSRGDACNPCGSCPSDTPVVMTREAFQRMASDPACARRLAAASAGGQPPACSPCPGAPVLPTASATCVGGSCVMRCTQLRSNGALAPTTSVPCAADAPTLSAPFDRATAERDVSRELDDFHDAASHADEARYFGHFTADAVFLGTDVTERWDLAAFRAYAHPHFIQGKGWTYHSLRRAVSFSPDGTVAWFDEDLLGERVGPTRGAGVLRRSDGRWKIALYDLSITIPNERFDAVRAVLDGGNSPAR